MDLIAVLVVVLASTFMLKEILRRFKIPVVVSQILTGIILGLLYHKGLLLDSGARSVIDSLSELGIIFLLFLAGWEIKLRKIISCAKDAVLIALSSAFFSFAGGFIFLYYGFKDALLSQGFNPLTSSIIFGIALSVTSEGTKVKVLMDMKKLDTHLGAIMIGAGTIDDIVEVLGLAFVLSIAESHTLNNMMSIPMSILLFTVFTYIGFRLISIILKYVERRETDADLFLLILILMFGMAT
ncbi:MAG: cation:proton antiporter, partial [Candidatus Altiarchaeota archaeon]